MNNLGKEKKKETRRNLKRKRIERKIIQINEVFKRKNHLEDL